MKKYLDDAKMELRKAEHLIFVSLKYTRTVDVFKSIIERMISTFDVVMNGLLEGGKQKKKVEEIPFSPILRCELLKKKSKNDVKFEEYMDFYLLLRKLSRASYTKSNEFRRHVTMTATLDTGDVYSVDIDKINEFYEKTKSFLDYVDGTR